ncbi:MAG: class I SAM-dependent methyltransferase [Lentisphaerae bacterium]|nr:class I SAM-dependent methyltransferase [Lentisphaerota bacterium]
MALAQRGFKVTGVDCSPFMLREARQRARQAKTKVEFVQSDMRDFVRPGTFDPHSSPFHADFLGIIGVH